jgi:hypothetical protein
MPDERRRKSLSENGEKQTLFLLLHEGTLDLIQSELQST